jgi:hypothetical protein
MFQQIESLLLRESDSNIVTEKAEEHVAVDKRGQISKHRPYRHPWVVRHNSHEKRF